MIDLGYNVRHWLTEDGRAYVAHDAGTEGSRGSIPAFEGEHPYAKARLVHMGADHVMCQRDLSPRLQERIRQHVRESYAIPEGSYDFDTQVHRLGCELSFAAR